jgi:hypothetical protein
MAGMMNRRRFMRRVLGGVAAVPAAGLLLTPALSWARQVERVSENDPVAFALGYVHDAADVDLSKYPRYEPGQICGNCQQWQGEPDAEWAPCAIIPNALVANPGWCSIWVRKVG